MKFLPFIFVLIFLTFPAIADISGPARVIDGDTIVVAGERIRLHGIDAPESNKMCSNADGTDWRCGEEATLPWQTSS